MYIGVKYGGTRGNDTPLFRVRYCITAFQDTGKESDVNRGDLLGLNYTKTPDPSIWELTTPLVGWGGDTFPRSLPPELVTPLFRLLRPDACTLKH